MRWKGHVAYMGEMRNTYKVLIRIPEGKNHSDDISIYGRLISECVLGK
jgi:hypothetical protein